MRRSTIRAELALSAWCLAPALYAVFAARRCVTVATHRFLHDGSNAWSLQRSKIDDLEAALAWSTSIRDLRKKIQTRS